MQLQRTLPRCNGPLALVIALLLAASSPMPAARASEQCAGALGQSVTTGDALSGELEILSWNKGNASIPANDEMLEDIRGSCHAVVAAYGH